MACLDVGGTPVNGYKSHVGGGDGGVYFNKPQEEDKKDVVANNDPTQAGYTSQTMHNPDFYDKKVFT